MGYGLDSKMVETLRSKIKAAAYTGHVGRQLDVVFSRFDKDGSGQLDDEEVRKTLRRTLRIPASILSDEAIYSFCAMLDNDDSGTVSVSEIVSFVGPEPETSRRTFKTLKTPRLTERTAQWSSRSTRGVSLSPDVVDTLRSRMKA